MDRRMPEPVLRAMWFALFASVALILGGFTVGYGTAMLAGHLAAPIATLPPLPTVAPEPVSGMDIARHNGAVVEGSAPEAVARAPAPTAVASSAPTVPATPQGAAPQGAGTAADLTVSLDGIDVNAAQGGVEIVLQLHNNSSRSISFSFWPAADLALSDDRGRRYELRWCEFEGAVQVPPKETVRLARAFFAGTPDQNARYVTVAVGHRPQLPPSSWEVPLSQ